jgi:hypothetical protein
MWRYLEATHPLAKHSGEEDTRIQREHRKVSK